MPQAIITKYLGPTNSKGSRIKATASAGSVTIPLDYSLSTEAAHAKAALTLAKSKDWHGRYVAGGMETGNVYVRAGNADHIAAETFDADGFTLPNPEHALNASDVSLWVDNTESLYRAALDIARRAGGGDEGAWRAFVRVDVVRNYREGMKLPKAYVPEAKLSEVTASLKADHLRNISEGC